MTQQTSPFIDAKWGWSLGESNWNLGMDENLLKFSYLFDRNVNGIVSSLPIVVNGEAYFNTTDNKIYYAVNGLFYSVQVPKWFIFTIRSTGENYIFDGSAPVLIPSPQSLGTAATRNVGVSLGNQIPDRTAADTRYAQIANLSNSSSSLLGSSLIGYYPNVTDAVGRLVQDKIREQKVSVKDFGAVGDGVTNDTVAIQNAITRVVNTGGTLYFPSGTYLHGAITVDTRNGGKIEGASRESVKIIPTANSIILYDLINSTVGITTLHPFSISNISFVGNGKTGVRAIRTTDFAFHTFECLYFEYLAYNIEALATTTGPLGFSTNLVITNIKQYGYGTFKISSAGSGLTNNRIFNVTISDIDQYSAGVAGWVDNWFSLRRVVNCNMTNITCLAMEGQVQGLYIVGASEGVFVTNAIFVYGTTLCTIAQDTDTVQPAWIYFTNCGFDQCAVTGIDIQASYVKLVNVNVTGGALRNNTGFGIQVRPTTTDCSIISTQVSNHKFSGFLIQSGADKVRLIGCDGLLNGQTSGSDLDCVATRPDGIFFSGNNFTSINTNGSTIINKGSNSSFVFNGRTQAATIANTTLTTLSTYTLPAGSFKGTEVLLLTAAGSFAANANTKTVNVTFGGTNLIPLTGAFNNQAWKIEAKLYRNGLTAWMDATYSVGSTFATSVANIVAVNLDNAITMTVTGQNGTASANDIIMNHFDIQLIR